MSLNHSPSIVTDGLVLCLDAANVRSYPKSGTTWSDLIGSNDGTLTNMDASNFDSANGGGLTFDGSIEGIATSTISLGSTFSAFFMLRFDGYNAVLAGGTSYNMGGYIFWVESSTSMYFSPTNGFAVANPNLSTNQWTHLGITRNGTSCTFYKNGTSFSTTSCGSGGLGIGAIGSYTGGSFPFNGDMASFVVYNRALTAQEVLQNYEATVGRYT